MFLKYTSSLILRSSPLTKSLTPLRRNPFLLGNPYQLCNFSTGNDKGPFGDKDSTGYESDGEAKDAEFESDRKFSNFVLFGGALILGICLLASQVKQQARTQKQAENSKQESLSPTTYTGKADIGGSWLLYDTKGEPVTHKDFAGKYYMIYFGFTYCPDVCPVSLIKMSKALDKVRQSKEGQYFQIESIFVSVDPNRDSNERIDEYCSIFHKDIHGLTHKTNDNSELKQMLKKFKIHVSKIDLTDEDDAEDKETLKKTAPEVVEKLAKFEKTGTQEEEEKYTLDHTIVVYLMGPQNQFLTYLGSNLDEGAMGEIILDEISADLKRQVFLKK